jgi:glycosyltransferase involved in cell wall biosynthesis
VDTSPNFESLTLFFPMWNEEQVVHQTIAAAREAAKGLIDAGEIGTYEILIVDDASSDATGEIADKYAADDPRIRVIHHPVNRKLGGTLKTGFAEARGELVLYTDADLPFDMAELAKAVRIIRVYEADIVSAFRFDRTGEGPRRFVYSFIYNHLVRSLFSLRVRDVNFAFKLIRRDVFEHIELKSEGSFIDVELLARANRVGYRIVQFGVDYFPRTRGVSTLSSASVIRHILREMIGLRNELRTVQPIPPESRGGAAARS